MSTILIINKYITFSAYLTKLGRVLAVRLSNAYTGPERNNRISIYQHHTAYGVDILTDERPMFLVYLTKCPAFVCTVCSVSH